MRARAILLGLALAAGSAQAQVSARASVTPPEVGLNRQFLVNVEVSGSQQIDGNPELPPMDFARFLGTSSSTSFQMINGKTTVSVTLQFRFQATRVGSFEIPPFTIRVGGKDVRTEPLQLTVSTNPPAGQAPVANDGSVAPEDLFITATPSKRRVYVNEPVTVTYRIYARVNIDGYSVKQRPSSPGFWVEDLDDPRQPAIEQVTRDGKQYVTAIIDRIMVFPTGPGRKVMEPLSVEAQVRVRRGRDPMNDPFFGDFFGGMAARAAPVVIATDSLVLDVEPLPESGKPADFTGFVGSLSVAATVDKRAAQVDEAITYRLTVTGDGNLKTLPDPTISFPADFEVYPPQQTQKVDRSGGRVAGSRTYEYVIIPRGPGARVIPAVQYGYYDLARGRYATARADSVVIAVTGTASIAAGTPAIAGRGRAGVEAIRRDIRFIRVAMPPLVPRDRTLFSSPVFWVVTLVPLLSVIGAAGLRRHQDRLSGDVAFARGRRASKVARQRLARAREILSPDTAREFHAELGKALQGFLADKLNLAEAGMIRDAVTAELARRGVAEAAAAAYLDCLDACDRYRFAPASVTPADMRSLLQRAADAMTDLDQALRK